MPRLPGVLRILWTAFKQWISAGAGRMGAALAYYTLFAIAPMLLIVITIAGAVYGEEAVRGELVGQIDQLVGRNVAMLVESLLRQAREGERGTLATILGAVTFVLGATGAFIQLQRSLNDIWRVKSRPGNDIVRFVLDRARSFGMIVALGFILLVSLVIDAGLSAANSWASGYLPAVPWIFQVLNAVVSLAVVTVVFALVYRILPDVELTWGDVWLGAVITAMLFSVGKRLIGLYLGQATPGSAYGAAGSVVIIMVWVWFSAQIVLLGATITRVAVRVRHRRVKPTELSEAKDRENREERSDLVPVKWRAGPRESSW